MIQSSELRVGAVYFGVTYEDDNYKRPLVKTYEYRGPDIYGAPDTPEGKRYFFRFIGTDETLELAEHQLHLILDLPGLIDALKSWQRGDVAGAER